MMFYCKKLINDLNVKKHRYDDEEEEKEEEKIDININFAEMQKK